LLVDPARQGTMRNRSGYESGATSSAYQRDRAALSSGNQLRAHSTGPSVSSVPARRSSSWTLRSTAVTTTRAGRCGMSVEAARMGFVHPQGL
jgi:hypothetical protein